MSNNSNLDAMLECGQASSEMNDRAIAILKADSSNETALRYKFIVGRIMARDTNYETAVDYAPAIDAKPGTKGKWQPFPNEPTTFDAKAHRPLVIHNRYRAALTAWSQVRASAGLASKVAPRAPRTGQGEGESVKDEPIIVSALAVETGLDTATIVKYVKAFDKWLTATLSTNKVRVRGDAGEALRKVEADLHAYVADLADALARDATPSPTVASARDAELEASRKAMEAMKAELEAMKAQAPKPKAEKLAKAA